MYNNIRKKITYKLKSHSLQLSDFLFCFVLNVLFLVENKQK